MFRKSIVTVALLILVLASPVNELKAQKAPPPQRGMSKVEYYNEILAPLRGYKALSLSKVSNFNDRKRGILDLGQLLLRISNAATLGYDRWGFNHEFPAGSNITYYWTMAPMVGAMKRVDGVLRPTVAIGTRGAARDSEEEFEPLGRLGGQPEYDAGVVDALNNIGIAFSDKPESWPAAWPIELDPTGTYTDIFTNISLEGVERNLDIDHPEGKGLRFPGVIDGKVVGEREAYFVVTDNDPLEGNTASSNNGVGPLDIRVDLWALQFSDILNQDFITFRQVITNVGEDTLFDVYVGIHGDPDCPEQGGAEWTDDYALFFPPNDPLMEEKIGVDDSLLWNLGIVWDGDDKSEGFLPSGVGWIGFKILETPIDPDNPDQQLGVTTFNVFAYSDAPQDDNGAYEQLVSGIQPPWNPSPASGDREQKPYSYGPDITWVIASGPFTLPPGESLPFSYASILGANEQDLLSNAILAQLLYNADYRAASSPPEPNVRAVAGNEKVTLYWDAYPSEYGVDPLTYSDDTFEGYRIYKSTDRGRTWGEPITSVDGVVQNYVPVAIYDVSDGITGVNFLNPYLDQGKDSGVRHYYEDEDVANGFEYWYAVCAFDRQDGTDPAVPPMENSRKRKADIEGDNTVAVVPRAPVAGYTQPDTAVSDVFPSPIAFGKGAIDVEIYDADLFGENSYDIEFYDTVTVVDTSRGTFTTITDNLYYVLRNLTDSQDELVSDVAERTVAGLVTEGETIWREESQYIEFCEGAYTKQLMFAGSSGFYSPDNPQIFPVEPSRADESPLFDGMRILAADNENLDFSGSGRPAPTFRDIQWVNALSDTDLIVISDLQPAIGGTPLVADYKVVFGDSSKKFDLSPTSASVPFQIFNMTVDPDTPLKLFVGNAPLPWKSGDDITLFEPEFPTKTWVFEIEWDTFIHVDTSESGDTTFADTSIKPQAGDEFIIRTYKPFVNGDRFTFSTQPITISKTEEDLLEGIKVVPNPYAVTSVYETSIEVKEVQFTHLPPEATIRIFNIAGELIQTIRHDNRTSIEPWNLRTYNGQEVAFGIYIFHVTAEEGQTQMGKFAIIK